MARQLFLALRFAIFLRARDLRRGSGFGLDFHAMSTTTRYITLSDGNLVDLIQEHTGHGVLEVRVGTSLVPEERPVVMRLTVNEAREFGLHLAGFVTNRQVLGGR